MHIGQITVFADKQPKLGNNKEIDNEEVQIYDPTECDEKALHGSLSTNVKQNQHIVLRPNLLAYKL